MLGSCQNKKTGPLTWSLKEGVLTISGQGAMPNYEVAPWDEERNTITKVIIGSGVETIGDNAFKNCKRIYSVIYTLSAEGECAIRSIGNSAFEGCYSLASIYIPNNVTTLGRFAYAGCKKVTFVAFSEKMSVIPESAFENCRNIEMLIIPDNIDSIQKNAFCGCRSLGAVLFGKNVGFIGDGAFRLCRRLSVIMCLNSVPPEIQGIEKKEFAFYDIWWVCKKENSMNTFESIFRFANIYVPLKAISDYKAANYWKTCTSFEELGDDLLGTYYWLNNENTTYIRNESTI